MKDYYSILKINRYATATDIKKSYRTLAMEWHPDRNNSKEAHEMFISINEAYEMLSDPYRRTEYDRMFFNSEVVTTEFSNWQNQAKEKAHQYADMDFEKFRTKILDEIILVAKHSPGLGCLAFILFGAVLGLGFIIKYSIEGDGDMVLIGVINLIFYGLLSIWAYPRFAGQYKEDRERMNNK
jgi:curved DNA-binding protein CbpA